MALQVHGKQTSQIGPEGVAERPGADEAAAEAPIEPLPDHAVEHDLHEPNLPQPSASVPASVNDPATASITPEVRPEQPQVPMTARAIAASMKQNGAGDHAHVPTIAAEPIPATASPLEVVAAGAAPTVTDGIGSALDTAGAPPVSNGGLDDGSQGGTAEKSPGADKQQKMAVTAEDDGAKDGHRDKRHKKDRKHKKKSKKEKRSRHSDSED